MNAQLQENFSEINDSSAVQYLTFRLDGEAFATEISKVREVLEFTKITRVPRSPGFMRGVINLRGSVVPVIDLRKQFGMPVAKRTVDTCIIILEVTIDDKATVIGALADSVQEVIDLKADQLSEAPTLGTRIDTQFISAMGKLDDRFVMVLDLDVIFTIDPELFSNFSDSYDDAYVDEVDDDLETVEHKAEVVTTEKTEEISDASVTPVKGIDLDSAIQKHAQWKLKLHSAISKEEELAVHEISSDNCCVLGKWLHGEARAKYSDLDSYLDCRQKHKAFHIEAGKVAQYINEKRYKEAEGMLSNGTPYVLASKDVASAIVAFRREIE